MTVFAIMATQTSGDALETAISSQYPDPRSYRFSDTGWFVSDKGTAREIAEKLGVRKGGIRGTVIVPIRPTYYGVASSALWEWLKTAIEEGGDG